MAKEDIDISEDEVTDSDPVDADGDNDAGGGGGGSGMTALLKEASAEANELGIMVPDDATDAEEWIEHFITAVKTHKGTKAMAEPAAPPADDISAATTEPKEEPQAVSMSMSKADQDRIERLEGFAADQVFGRMGQVVDDLIGKGQITPVKGNAWKETLGKKRLSLLPGKHDNEVANVLSQLELAKEVPEGTFWSTEEKTARLSRKASPADAPAHVDFTKGDEAPSGDQVQKILDEQFGPKK